MNKISVKETLVTARDLRAKIRQQKYFGMSLISVIIIPTMEYHFVKDLGNRDALSGF